LEKEPIGQGAYGTVFKGKWRDTEVACKQMDRLTKQGRIDFEQEAEIMRNIIPHKNLVTYFGVCVNQSYPICMIIEYIGNGNICDYLQNKPLANDKIASIIKGMVEGMKHLSSQKIVHRDLAARNILLTTEFEAKISDFGLARVLDKYAEWNTTNSDIGPIRWMSPEAVMSRQYSEKSDVWSWAVTVVEILTKQEPYKGYSLLQVASLVPSGKLSLSFDHNVPILSQIIAECLRREPDSRPTFATIAGRLSKFSTW